MAEGGQNLVGGAQILVDRLGFRRRLDNDDIHVIPMAYGKSKGRFRETRVGVSNANMGGEAVAVKWRDGGRGRKGGAKVSWGLQYTSCSCAPKTGILDRYTNLDIF
jgi:hypothetical protein